EALAVNRKMLGDAERIFGADDNRLTTVLMDLAQNHYELKHFDDADAALRRALALAQRSDKDDIVDESLFQLGVLAFERGDIAGARRWMKQRVQIATSAKDPERLARAEAAAAELEKRHAKP